VDIERVVGVLQWAVREMDRRYKVFADAGARNIAVYNAQAIDRGSAALPYLVILVDELADLMMTVPEEAERLIPRLAQLARATGIHLVIATQRPSVDVVTGLIKANFPARIAFAVSSSVDSRVILDSAGAEKLLGRGDMLYQASDSSKLRRLQGCFVADGEIERLVRFWRQQVRPVSPGAEPSRQLGLPEPLIQAELWEAMAPAPGGRAAAARDPMWDEAVALIGRHHTASTSFLQRKLRIGYARAARLLDQLEAAGLVGPAQGNLPREVRVDSSVSPGASGTAADGADGEATGSEDDNEETIRPWLRT
jgi:S-DNA-T family DNA segregation ATPase FtsK/SpoIIIE